MPPPTLLTLPTELQLLITTHLTTPELQLLRMTSTHFHTFTHPLSAYSILASIENSPYNRRRYVACPTCITLLPLLSNFTPASDSHTPAFCTQYRCKKCKTYVLRYIGDHQVEGYEWMEEYKDWRSGWELFRKEELRQWRRKSGLDPARWDDIL